MEKITSFSKELDGYRQKNIDKLFKIYQKQQYTPGELKMIFAHLYIELMISKEKKFNDLTIFFKTDSFKQLLNKQKKGK